MNDTLALTKFLSLEFRDPKTISELQETVQRCLAMELTAQEATKKATSALDAYLKSCDAKGLALAEKFLKQSLTKK